MSEKLGDNHESEPEVSEANTAPESELSAAQSPNNTYGLKPEDIEQLERFFKAFIKKDLDFTALRTIFTNKTVREFLLEELGALQAGDIFGEIPEKPKRSFIGKLFSPVGDRLRALATVTFMIFEVLGKRQKDVEGHYAFDLARIVEKGFELKVIVDILRDSGKRKALDVLPDENLVDYLGSNALRRLLWGIPFDAQMASLPTRADFDEIEEL